MRLPRLRFTVRSLMLIVALAATVVGGTLFYQRSSEAAQRDGCRSNLLSIVFSLQGYSSAHGSFPSGTVTNDRLPPEKRLSWLTIVWSFLEQLFWIFNLSESWDSEANRVTRWRGVDKDPQTTGRLAVLCCPAATGSSNEHMPGWTWYVGIAGVGTDAPTLPTGHPRAGVFGYGRDTPLAVLKDGASNTLLVAETGLANGPWTAGGAATVRGLDPSRQPYIGRGHQFGGLHRGGVMVAMADGSVRFLRESIDSKVFEAISTVSGGEILPPDWDR
jgi:prepilin-type processing-associated H-X9-DG protein